MPVATVNDLVRYSERYRVFSASDSEMAGLDAGMVLDLIYRDLEDSSAHARSVPDYRVFGIAAASGILSKQERVAGLSEVSDR